MVSAEPVVVEASPLEMMVTGGFPEGFNPWVQGRRRLCNDLHGSVAEMVWQDWPRMGLWTEVPKAAPDLIHTWRSPLMPRLDAYADGYERSRACT